MIYYISLSWDWLAIVPDHLFAPVEHVGSHSGDPLQCIIGLFLFVIFGVVDDRGLPGQIYISA